QGRAGRNRRPPRTEWSGQNNLLLHDCGLDQTQRREGLLGSTRHHAIAHVPASQTRHWLPGTRSLCFSEVICGGEYTCRIGNDRSSQKGPERKDGEPVGRVFPYPCP